MAVNPRRQLRLCTFCALAFVVCQFWLLLLLTQYGNVHHFISSKLLLRRHNVYVADPYHWREFVAYTPKKPNNFYQYNRERSDKVGAVRILPGTRHDSCNTRSYVLPSSSQAKVSIVISFHNEARSMLLRTIISLVSRTPEKYLHELIIIDDYSEDASLLHELNELLKKMYAKREQLNLLFIRNLRRMGLIWSRNKGASQASGHYLLFMDSHCEVNEGWLEPLLERLALNKTRAVSPLLDRIDDQTLSYRPGNELLMGAFDWSLHFHWWERVLADHETAEQQYSSPVFAGGTFMISRKWFLKLQGFNKHLQIWGGESIEFAIKLWLCGGQIEIVPCSRIGHIFRSRHAFEFPVLNNWGQDASNIGQATYLRNSKIIAESWLEDYKYLFYALKPAAKQIPLNYTDHELNLFKTAHQCRHFDWYLRHVHKHLKLHNDEYSALGTLRNAARCLLVQKVSTQLVLASCYHSEITQWHLHRSSGQLRTEFNQCLSVVNKKPPKGYQLLMEPCSNANDWQRWQRRGTQLMHNSTHLCLDNPLKDQLELSACRSAAASQSFQFSLEMKELT